MASDHANIAARPLDHVVLPVADLATARGRLTELGFTVAPDGVHPFGTANCCVYFADGTFLEPLAVADRERAEAAAGSGNVFTARDAAYRHSVGENGFSAVVVGSEDAPADHARFVATGLSAGQVLEFSRPFIDAAGGKDTASFRLAFAADPNAPDVFFFAVQRLNSPSVDKGALQTHANGARRIGKVLFSAKQPGAFANILAKVTGGNVHPVGDQQLAVAATNATLAVMTPAALESEFGVPDVVNPSLRAAGLVFGVADLDQTEALLRTGKVAFERRNGRLIVRPAPGQGATFIFEESE